MGLDKLISAIAVVAGMAVATGQLPRIINGVHRAQVQLIQDSKASKWPKAISLGFKINRINSVGKK